MPIAQLNGQIDFVQQNSYSAQDVRRSYSDFPIGPGCFGYPDLRIAAVSGMTVQAQPGMAIVRQPADGSLYRVSQDNVALSLTLTTANASNPRLDQIILRVYDNAVDGSSQFLASIETIDGTPTSGATLDNRSGAADPQASLSNAKAYIPLADVLVGAGASSITNANIRSRRPFGMLGVVPPLGINAGSTVDAVTFMPHPGHCMDRCKFLGTDHAGRQSAALMYLPRRIAATRIRWRYMQDTTNNVGATNNWNIGIFDASGRLISSTGSTAFSGAAGTSPNPTTTLPAPYAGYVYDIGWYYVWFGISSGITAGTFWTMAATCGRSSDNNLGRVPSMDNIFLSNNPGNITVPSTLLGFVDGGAANPNIHVPIPSLTIG